MNHSATKKVKREKQLIEIDISWNAACLVGEILCMCFEKTIRCIEKVTYDLGLSINCTQTGITVSFLIWFFSNTWHIKRNALPAVNNRSFPILKQKRTTISRATTVDILHPKASSSPTHFSSFFLCVVTIHNFQDIFSMCFHNLWEVESSWAALQPRMAICHASSTPRKGRPPPDWQQQPSPPPPLSLQCIASSKIFVSKCRGRTTWHVFWNMKKPRSCVAAFCCCRCSCQNSITPQHFSSTMM